MPARQGTEIWKRQKHITTCRWKLVHWSPLLSPRPSHRPARKWPSSPQSHASRCLLRPQHRSHIHRRVHTTVDDAGSVSFSLHWSFPPSWVDAELKSPLWHIVLSVTDQAHLDDLRRPNLLDIRYGVVLHFLVCAWDSNPNNHVTAWLASAMPELQWIISSFCSFNLIPPVQSSISFLISSNISSSVMALPRSGCISWTLAPATVMGCPFTRSCPSQMSTHPRAFQGGLYGAMVVFTPSQHTLKGSSSSSQISQISQNWDENIGHIEHPPQC